MDNLLQDLQLALRNLRRMDEVVAIRLLGSVLASLPPAFRAASIQPGEALRQN